MPLVLARSPVLTMSLFQNQEPKRRVDSICWNFEAFNTGSHEVRVSIQPDVEEPAVHGAAVP